MALVVVSNVLYNVASKSLPRDCSPYVALVVTYLTAAFLSLVGYFLFDSGRNIVEAFAKVNWTGFALGISMVGLEIGFIFMYRAGWKISIGSLVANLLLALALIAVGIFFYKERLSTQQLIGIILSCIGVTILLTHTHD